MYKLNCGARAARFGVLATGAVMCGLQSVQAQAIDPSSARAVLGEPLSIEIRVRPTTGAPDLTPRCIDAEFEWGDVNLSPDEVRVSLEAEPHSGWTRVRLSHPHRVNEPLVSTRITLRCGAHFVREFPVLADPVDPVRRTARAAIPKHGRPSGDLPWLTHAAPSVSHGVAPPRTPADLLSGPASGADATAPAPQHDRLAALPATPRALSSAALLDELTRQGAQLEKVQQSLNAMKSQQSQHDRDRLGPWWSASALALGVALVGLVRIGGDSWHLHQPALRRFVRRPQRRASGTPPAIADSPGTTVAPTAPATTSASPVRPPSPEHAALWADADFGRPALGDAPGPDFLRQVESLIADGYPGGALLMLEKALQTGPDKNPWLLLALLDLYGEMGQPWNQARVAAQLEALYNVQIPPQGGDALAEGAPLDEHNRTLRHILQHWSTADARDALARVLLRPPEFEPLSLAAFRTALLLHAISASNDDEAGPPAFDPLIDWSPAPDSA